MEARASVPGTCAGTARAERPPRRVLIIDDNTQVRHELRTLLPLAGEIEIAGEAADGLEAIRLAGALRPEVVLMDLEMPGTDGHEAARQIKAASPSCRIVVLTVHGDDEARCRAARSGADAFLVKGTSLERLLEAILGTPADRQGTGVTVSRTEGEGENG